ncbi:DUF418 domain-containing protein [Brevibacillus daliensis]|uniref:DUF418 domain-containing protein n=1 Tax=Brevibacillus daliensis TaxID=2892995 RepID=UPI001E4B590D|nr:DUF418 domain-containing protein [Brevibacillus daliensis]
MIRGFAIFGIFLVNFPTIMGMADIKPIGYTAGVDATVRFLYDLLIQTKFYSIFAFLFGLGFYLFMKKAEEKGKRMYSLFVRRLLILLLFGVLHLVLLWYGDILHLYALTGFWLLLFYKRNPRTILIWSIGLITSFALLMLSVSSVDLPTGQISLQPAPFNGLLDYSAVVAERIKLIGSLLIWNSILYQPEVLGLFLLGLYAGKKEWFRRVPELVGKIRIIQFISLGLSAMLAVPMFIYYVNADVYVSEQIYGYIHLTGKTLSVFYVCTLMLLYQKQAWRKRLEGFTFVGRMALSNYLGQTFFSLLLFSFLIPNTASIPLWVGTIYCFTMYMLQILFSRWWLARYAFGPMEWLWRCGTYGTIQPLRHLEKRPR